MTEQFEPILLGIGTTERTRFAYAPSMMPYPSESTMAKNDRAMFRDDDNEVVVVDMADQWMQVAALTGLKISCLKILR